MNKIVVFILVAAAGFARADSTPPPVEAPLVAAVRIRGAGAHEAARFVAKGFRANLVMVGTDRDLDLAFSATTVDEAMAVVARAAGLGVARWGNTFLIGPAALVEAVRPSKATRHDPNVDLDFYRVAVPALQKLLAEVAHDRALVDGTTGEATLLIRNRPASEVAEWIEKLTVDKRLPIILEKRHAEPPTDPGGGSNVAPPQPYDLKLPSVKPEEIELVGTFLRGTQHFALVRWRGMLVDDTLPSNGTKDFRFQDLSRKAEGATEFRAVEVRAGDHLGTSRARVETVAPDAIDLEGKIHLPLRR